MAPFFLPGKKCSSSLKPYFSFVKKEKTSSPLNNMAEQTCVDGYTSLLDYEALVLVQDLYRYGKAGQLPINPQPHAGRCSLNNMLTITFGTRTNNIADPLVGQALRLSREFMSVLMLFSLTPTHGYLQELYRTGIKLD